MIKDGPQDFADKHDLDIISKNTFLDFGDSKRFPLHQTTFSILRI